MLRERGVGEVDDVDIEMDGLVVGPVGEELQRLAGGSLRVAPDLFQCHAGQAQPLDLPSFEPGRVGQCMGEEHDLAGVEEGAFPAAAVRVGSAPSTASMWPRAIQSRAPSVTLAGVLRSECRSK